ncbi:glycosyltransferase [Bacillus safensis]|uniref:bifunctional glycosyltransferase/CDP-glycerol:glycerophosphate glycerophosphotransferase n=1 Tax=Bacillus safensis TaxID=561879 RepID=UPI00203F2D11|nr:glycosyltransferase [Bacillus safensis]MCM3026697.1 glycosyltransferase [Bacillus safensis]
MNFNYDMTIIIPLFNSEDYVEDTIKSIMKQTHDFTKIQVIFVDDGSTDRSYEICNEYVKQYTNMEIYAQENLGVSAARNFGLKQATGKYILFLDSDDLIGSNTIQGLFNYFNQIEDEVSIVAYPLYSLVNGKVKDHPRTKNYSKTGVYDVSVYPNINQTTINVCVKNLPSNERIYFDTDLAYAEDATFNTAYIMKTGRIGICSTGRYIYRTHQSSTVVKYRSPVHSYNMLLLYFEKMMNSYSDNNVVHPYVQSMILYELNWRFKSKSLIPFHLDQDEFSDWKKRMFNIIEKLEDTVILNHDFIDIYHKASLLSLKQPKPTIKHDSQGIYIYRHNQLLFKQQRFEIVMTQFTIKDNQLLVSGFIKSPLNEFLDLNLQIEVNGQSFVPRLSSSNHGYYKTRMKTNNFHRFSWKKELDGQALHLKFSINYKNYDYPVSFYFINDVVFQSFMKHKAFKNGYALKFLPTQQKIIVEKAKKDEANSYTKEFDKIVRKHDKKLFVARKLINKKRKDIWLYNDRKNIIDNAYYQFKHDFPKNDGVKRYYVYDGDSIDLENMFSHEERKNVIKFRSRQHKYLFLNATKILTSFRTVQEYSAFSENRLKFINDRLDFELVYLQHGILHAHTPWIYSSEKNKIDKFVVSSNFEKQNLIENYNYRSESIIETGMARFDFVKNHKPTSNKIIFAPSWRVSLVNSSKGGEWTIKEEAFKNSSYYNEINTLISSKEFTDLLEEEDLYFELKLHPIFNSVINEFKNEHPRIHFVTKDINLSDYKLFITDFSSFVFDFAFLNRAVLFFIPDYAEFICGNHLYNKLDLNLEDSFGPLVTNSSSVIEAITSLAKNDFQMENIHKERMSNFFYQHKSYREALYQKLTNQKK